MFGNKLKNSIATLIVVSIIAGITGWCCYSFQPSWNFTYAATWWLLGIWVSLAGMVVVSIITADKDFADVEENFCALGKSFLSPLIVCGILVILMIIFGIANGNMCTANKRFNYVEDMVTISNESTLPELVGKDGNTDNIPVIEDTEAFKKANATLAEGSLGNKNSVNTESLTSQEVNGKFIYTLTLKPNNWFKWDGRTKGYITIDRNNGKTSLIKDEFKYSIDAKYGNLLFHGTNNVKKLLISTYGGKWTDIDMEIDDEGNPYWVATKVTQSGVNGYTKVLSIATINPDTGDIKLYNIGEEPSWVERVYPEEVLLEYLGYYGSFIHGWVNSWKTGEDVLEVTSGYNIVYIDGIPHVWTGLTTKNANNNASVGIAIANLKTGAITIHKNAGISEEHAQASAMGLVQEKGYTASFPVVFNFNDEPAYFMLLRDDNENVQGYAFVSYKDYTKSAFGTTVTEALTAFKSKLNTVNNTENLNNVTEVELKSTVTAIATEVVDGRTVYYVRVTDSDKTFTMQSGLNVDIVFLKIGDAVIMKHYETNANVVSINAISIK